MWRAPPCQILSRCYHGAFPLRLLPAASVPRPRPSVWASAERQALRSTFTNGETRRHMIVQTVITEVTERAGGAEVSWRMKQRSWRERTRHTEEWLTPPECSLGAGHGIGFLKCMLSREWSRHYEWGNWDPQALEKWLAGLCSKGQPGLGWSLSECPRCFLLSILPSRIQTLKPGKATNGSSAFLIFNV